MVAQRDDYVMLLLDRPRLPRPVPGGQHRQLHPVRRSRRCRSRPSHGTILLQLPQPSACRCEPERDRENHDGKPGYVDRALGVPLQDHVEPAAERDGPELGQRKKDEDEQERDEDRGRAIEAEDGGVEIQLVDLSAHILIREGGANWFGILRDASGQPRIQSDSSRETPTSPMYSNRGIISPLFRKMQGAAPGLIIGLASSPNSPRLWLPCPFLFPDGGGKSAGKVAKVMPESL